jgi:hypothetical protein
MIGFLNEAGFWHACLTADISIDKALSFWHPYIYLPFRRNGPENVTASSPRFGYNIRASILRGYKERYPVDNVFNRNQNIYTDTLVVSPYPTCDQKIINVLRYIFIHGAFDIRER